MKRISQNDMGFILHEKLHLLTQMFLTRKKKKKINYLYMLWIFGYCEGLEDNNKH